MSADSYYGRPVLKEPVWQPEIPWYFFTGGLAGASSVLELVARLAGNEPLARRSLYVGAAADIVSPALLISDLGRPERFLNMFRVFKVTSPMSVGSWILGVSGGASGDRGAARGDRAAEAGQVRRRGRLRRCRARRSPSTRRRCLGHGGPGLARGAERAAVPVRLERRRERRRGGGDRRAAGGRRAGAAAGGRRRARRERGLRS